jgi:hypothetical protein
MSKLITKNWRIESIDGSRVVRLTSAGIILSDCSNQPTLFDFQTAKSVSEQIQGIMSLEKFIVVLIPKQEEPKPRNPNDTASTCKAADRPIPPDRTSCGGGTD